MEWDPEVHHSSPFFARLLDIWRLSIDAWPTPNDYNVLWGYRPVFEGGPLTFAAISNESHLSFEQQIVKQSTIGMRLHHWHDHFNNLSWLAWPHTKSAISQRYVSEMKEGQRSRSSIQNALAQWDECGAVICASRAVLELIQAHAWEDVFKHPLQCHVFGHGVMDKLRSPYIGLTVKALLIESEIKETSAPEVWEALDQRVAQIAATLVSPKQLQPFPLLGITGAWPHQDAAFYKNTDYFRPRHEKAQSEIHAMNPFRI